VLQGNSAAAVTELRTGVRGLGLRQIVDGVTSEGEWRFDDAGRLERILLPGSTQQLVLEHEDGGDAHVRAEDGRWYATLSAGGARYANGVEERWELDPAGRPTRLVATGPDGQPLLDLGLAYGDDGRICALGEWQIAFQGRFVHRLARGDETVTLSHDESGNLVRRSGERFRNDAHHRVRELERDAGGRIRFDYDADGNRVARRDGRTTTIYRYDANGRLAEVRRAGRILVRYGYDELGRRVRREAERETRVLHYDPRGNLVAETDETGRATATYLWAGRRCLGRIDGPVGEPVAEWYHLDHRGTAAAVSGPAGELLARHGGHPLEPPALGPFQGKLRDPATGVYDFGCRDYDPETDCFTTPDAYTWDADDPRLMALGLEPPHQHPDPARRNRYAFCLGDPIDNVDLDGHSAWWFFLTIPSSLTWALPNTVIALIIVFANLLMEILGWLIWFFVCIGNRDFALKHYPWGNLAQNGANPTNPFEPEDRAHIWFGMEASARLGVPWALLNGSFFVWRPYTLGNVIFAEDMTVAADEAEPNARFVVPNDPDVQLNREDALWNHEMQHVFQYAYLGPLFHCLPIPPLARLISNAVGDDPLADRDEWWEKIDLGGLTWAVGGLFSLMTGFKLKPDDFAKWINPATWWRELLPNKVVDIAANAIDFNNWLPGVGVYEISSVWFTNQENSFFERNAGANSGDVYQTVVEVEENELWVGGFTRVVGADQTAKATPASPTPRSNVAWTISPVVSLPLGPWGAAGNLNPEDTAHKINFDSVNTLPVRVVNADGFYFHALAPGTHTVEGTGDQSGAKESVKIKVKDVGVTLATSVVICSSQTISVSGDPAATYSARLVASPSGGSLTGMTYTAGQNAGTDTIEILARYSATGAPFAKYGDNGLGGVDYSVKTIDVTVREPVITPAANEVFVGGTVAFAIDAPPLAGASTANVAGSQFDLAGRRFVAGKGPIAANQDETVTIDYGCRQYTFTITVKPITAAIAPAIVDEGGTATVTVTGGTPPYRFRVSRANSQGATIDDTGDYTAGSVTAQVVDTITVSDRNGQGGRARVTVTVRPT
jgi:RHS repeat-associated protein